MIPFIRSPYNYDVKAVSDETAIPTIGPSLTVQSQSEDADINVLMHRYGITGKFPENPLVPTYADYTNVGDFRSALHAIQHASEAFMQYPATFRSRFDNDPQKFLSFATNPDNIPEMKQLGMFKNAAETSGGGSPPQSGSPAQAGGARAPVRDGGAAVPQRPAESGAVVSDGKG